MKNKFSLEQDDVFRESSLRRGSCRVAGPEKAPQGRRTTIRKFFFAALAIAALGLFTSQAWASDDIVQIGHDAEVAAGESAADVVVIAGSAKVDGTAHGDVVVIGGDADVDGDVHGDLVVICGDVHLGSNAVISHDLVTIGGSYTKSPGATVHGKPTQLVLPTVLQFRWLKSWVRECVFKLRPLSFGVGWVWWFAGIAFLIYLLVAALFPHPVARCSQQLTERPAMSFAAALLVKLALPVVSFILVCTIIGALVVPFIFVAEILALIVGKAALLEFLGGKVLGVFGRNSAARPVGMLVIGALLVTLLYVVPVVGFLTYLIISIWGFGAAVTAFAVSMKRSSPPPNPAPDGPSAYATQHMTTPVPASGGPSTPPFPGVSWSAPGAAAAAANPSVSAAVPPALIPPQALAMPRAGFWERMGAGFLDLILVLVLTLHWTGPFVVLVLIAYFSAMWAWKGTTVGGIVLNLHVARLSGQPMDFLTAFVRSLAALFSFFMLFLGFFWIAWDRDKQGWHDKIAGTVVVRLPKAVPLVCV